MSEAFKTDLQEPPGVSTLAVAGPVVAIFLIAAAVMAILVGAFWIKLGTLPTDMFALVRHSFAPPRLQVDPLGDLRANRIRAERQLKGVVGAVGVGPTGGAPAVTAVQARPSAPGSRDPQTAAGAPAAELANAVPAAQAPTPQGMSIDTAMAKIVERADPYAPLLSQEDVPDSAARRATEAYRAARSGGVAVQAAHGSDADGTALGGARTGAGTPPAGTDAPSSVRGLGGRTVWVPAASLDGTPTYDGARNEGAVTR